MNLPLNYYMCIKEFVIDNKTVVPFTKGRLYKQKKHTKDGVAFINDQESLHHISLGFLERHFVKVIDETIGH